MKWTLVAWLLGAGMTLGAAGAEPSTISPTPAPAAAADPILPVEIRLDAVDDAAAWRIHRSDHFQVIFRRDPLRARAQGELLEATYARFFEVFDGFGLDAVDQPLTCLFFESKDDYLRYAREADHVDMSWTVAYYSARTNRIAFYRYGGAWPTVDDSNERAEDQEQLYGSASGRSEVELGRRGQVSLASATHEAAHQLAFNSGLQRRGVRYPLWVSEGLATNFELVAPGGDVGPSQPNPTRLRRLRTLDERRGLTPLHRFVAVTRPPTDDARATDAMYAQAWGLFRYLYQQRPAALSAYLHDLRALPAGERSADTMRAEFIRRFGPVERVESQWRQWIAEQ